ncbi:hypothetical protein LEMLEM_LOCUS16744 [Lemmus lemmus]
MPQSRPKKTKTQ